MFSASYFPLLPSVEHSQIAAKRSRKKCLDQLKTPTQPSKYLQRCGEVKDIYAPQCCPWCHCTFLWPSCRCLGQSCCTWERWWTWASCLSGNDPLSWWFPPPHSFWWLSNQLAYKNKTICQARMHCDKEGEYVTKSTNWFSVEQDVKREETACSPKHHSGITWGNVVCDRMQKYRCKPKKNTLCQFSWNNIKRGDKPRATCSFCGVRGGRRLHGAE